MSGWILLVKGCSRGSPSRSSSPGRTSSSSYTGLISIREAVNRRGTSGAKVGAQDVFCWGLVAIGRVRSDDEQVAELVRRVGGPRAGDVVTFQGVTGEVERLEYEAYVEMAEDRMAQIVADAIARHRLCAAADGHRLGPVPLSELSVAVAVSAPHRAEAFEGAREVIDRIKAEAPIWKREVERGERRWAEGSQP